MNDQMQATCGGCRHWVRLPGDGVRTGECHFNPPMTTPGGVRYRPRTPESERACGRHQPLEAGQPAAVAAKKEPPVPAYMADAIAKKKVR